MAATLSITILANATAAKKAFSETTDSAETLGDKVGGMGKLMAAGAAAGAAGLVALGVGAYQAAAESARIGRETERVITTTGAAAWTSAAQVSALAGAISDKSGADDEAIQSGANLLLTFTNVQNAAGEGNDVFDQATQAALDMSTALGTDMSGASIQLGKALNDPIKGLTALAKSGVSFTAQQREQIQAMVEAGDVLGAQKIILGEVQKEFGGAAEAAATPIDKLMVKVGNLQEGLGGLLIPAVDAVATALGDTMGPALEAATGFIADHGEAVKLLASVGLAALAAAYGPVIAAQVLMVGGNILGYVKQVTAAVSYAGEAFMTVAAQQGVLAASTQAVSYAFAALGPMLAVFAAGAAIYAIVSAFDESSDAADRFWESVNRDVDPSNLAQVATASEKVTQRLTDLTRAQGAAGFGDLAASAADLLIPFTDVENSLMDQQKEHDSLTAKQKEHDAAVLVGTDALRLYADAQAGVTEANRTSIPYWADSTTLMSDAEVAAGGITTKLQDIAHSQKIDLAEPGAAARVQAIYEKTLFVTQGTLGMSEAQQKYNDASSTAKDKTDAYKQSLDALIGVHISAAAAETQFSQNSLGLLKTLTEQRYIANGATQAGTDASIAQVAAINANNTAIQGNVKSAIDLANAMFQETGNAGEATATLYAHRQSLIDVMVQSGYTKEAAEAYINRLGLTPQAIETQVLLENKDATNKIAGTQGQLDQYAKGAHADLTVDTTAADRALDKFYRDHPGFVGPIGPQTALDWANSHRAAGGPVVAGGSYIVGERGPELFLPAVAGRIVPNGAAAMTAAGTGGVTNVFNITVPSTGLGPDSPGIQRDLVTALTRWSARNGPLPAPVAG